MQLTSKREANVLRGTTIDTNRSRSRIGPNASERIPNLTIDVIEEHVLRFFRSVNTRESKRSLAFLEETDFTSIRTARAVLGRSAVADSAGFGFDPGDVGFGGVLELDIA